MGKTGLSTHFLKIVRYVRDYPTFMTIWEPKNGEFLKTRLKPEHELGKYAIAVIKNSVVVGHFAKGKTGRFAKSI